jgi:hypothetical protein
MRTAIPAIILYAALLSLGACTSNEIGSSRDVNPASVYFDYNVWGDEEGGTMNVKLQYRFAGANGTTLLLEAPSKVEFDGVQLRADSSRMAGAYYEVIKPISEFTGRHTIVFTDPENKQYREEFSFHPISLRTQLPPTVTRGELILDLDGLAPTDYLHVMLNDTSRSGSGIDRVDTVKNGHIVLSARDFDSLASGPIRLEISREDERKLKEATPQGGRFSYSYGLKRSFNLK